MGKAAQAIFENWPALIAIVVWSLIWKGAALWKSARRDDFKWFIALLVLNTLGLLEILYIFVFSRKRDATGGINDYPSDITRKKVI